MKFKIYPKKMTCFFLSNSSCRTLVVIDGYNAFFSPKTRALREDKSVILPSEFVLTEAFLSLTKNDWVSNFLVLSIVV